MTEPAIAAAPHETFAVHTEEAAREPVRPPEHAEAATQEAAAEPQAEAPAATADNVVLFETTRVRAGEQLRDYLVAKIAEGMKQKGLDEETVKTLTEPLQVNLFGELSHGKTDVKVRLSGSEVGANEALFGELATQALKEHPSFAPYFEVEQPPHAQKVAGAEQSEIEIHIPQLETAAYVALFGALATPVAPAPAQEQAATIEPGKVKEIPTPGSTAPETAEAHAAEASAAAPTAAEVFGNASPTSQVSNMHPHGAQVVSAGKGVV